MLFSVVVPVHNGEKYIESCIGSVLAQEDTHLGPAKELMEVIIVENGSTDRTAGITDKLAAENPIIKTIHRGRIGLFAARQEGFIEARGDYVISLDGDDSLERDALKRLCKRLFQEDDAWNDVDMVLFRGRRLRGDTPGEVIAGFELQDNKVYCGDDKEELYKIFCYSDALNSMWTKCIKRSIATMEHGDFINNGEDLYQTTRYLERADRIGFMEEALYLYRVGEASMTSTYNAGYLDNQKIVWKAMDEFLARRNNPEYVSWVDERKSLTCSIFVASVIYSNIGLHRKKQVLDKLMKDEFYKTYAKRELPKWAPEESVFVHGLLVSDNPIGKLMMSALKHDAKTRLKRAWR